MHSIFRAAGAAIVAFAVFISIEARSQELFSPFVGSQPDIIDRMVKLAKLKGDEVAVDLGSGDGRIILAAALTHPKIRGWGVDIDEKLVAYANAFALEEGVAERIKFLHGDVFDADLSGVDVIFMWLLPELQRLLRTKILAEARPGTRIVSNLFDLGSWPFDASDPEHSLIKMWIVPAKVQGNWNWTLTLDGVERRYSAVLDQHFQQVEGVIRVGDWRRELREVRLQGDRLSFWMSLNVEGLERVAHEFSGVVRGDRIEGTVRFLVPKRSASEDDVGDGMEEFATAPWVAVRSNHSAYFERTRSLSVDSKPQAKNN